MKQRRFRKAAAPLWITVGLVTAPLFAASTFPGYTFYASGKMCYLLDSTDTQIHTWSSSYTTQSSAHLLRDSSVFFPCSDKGSWTGGGALVGGRLQIIAWDGTVTWDFPFNSSTFVTHHNVNVLYRTDDPTEKPTVIVACYTNKGGNTYGEMIVELRPTGLNTADTVWKWDVDDHLTTDGANHPELIVASAGGSGDMGMVHCNNIDWNRELDQIVLDAKEFGEFWVIDHSTTTEEAASHSGGRSGKGGDLVYRWGNPANYGASGTNYLHGQHGATWIPSTMLGSTEPMPGAGNMLVISNQDKKGYEVAMPTANIDGTYDLSSGGAYDPASPSWSVSITNMANNEGNIMRLPNGNTFINNNAGTFMEVNSSGQTVWSLNKRSNMAFRYPYGYLGSAGGTGVGSPSVLLSHKSMRLAVQNGIASVSFSQALDGACYTLCAVDGTILLRGTVDGTSLNLDVGAFSAGAYVLSVTGTGINAAQRFSLVH